MYRNRRDIGWDATLHILIGLCCALVFLNARALWVVTLSGVVGFVIIAVGLVLATICIFDL